MGGIYSVIKSKAAITTAEYGDRYCLIGPLNRHSVRTRHPPSRTPSPYCLNLPVPPISPPPYIHPHPTAHFHHPLSHPLLPPSTPLISDADSLGQAAVEVEALEPQNEQLKATLDSMADRGISYVYGRWLIEGAPKVLLFDTKTGYKHLDEWKGDLWSTAMIPCPPGDDETNEAVVFGYLVAWFLGEVSYRQLLLLTKAESRDPITDYYFSSSLVTKPQRRSSRISTSGLLVLLYPSAASAALTSPRSSQPMLPCSDDTFVQDPSTFTTTSSFSTSMPKPESEESTTVTVSNAPQHTPPMSSPPFLTSPPTRVSTCSSESQMVFFPTV